MTTKTKKPVRRLDARDRDRLARKRLAKKQSAAVRSFDGIEDTPKGIRLKYLRNGLDISWSRSHWIHLGMGLFGSVLGAGIMLNTLGMTQPMLGPLLFGGAIFLAAATFSVINLTKREHVILQDGEIRVFSGMFGLGKKRSIPAISLKKIGKSSSKGRTVGMVRGIQVSNGVKTAGDSTVTFYGYEEISTSPLNNSDQADYVVYATDHYCKTHLDFHRGY